MRIQPVLNHPRISLQQPPHLHLILQSLPLDLLFSFYAILVCKFFEDLTFLILRYLHIFIRLRFYGLFVFNVNVDSMNV